MKQYTQKEIEILIEQYNSTDKTVIKKNTQRILAQAKELYNYGEIAIKNGLSEQTIYQYNKDYVTNYPNFLTALKLANFLNIDITEFIK